MKTKRTKKQPTPSALASVSGCAATKDLALQLWMQDVTSLLCYQPEVAHAHKESLVKALDHYNKRCAELDEAQRHNAKSSATAGAAGANPEEKR